MILWFIYLFCHVKKYPPYPPQQTRLFSLKCVAVYLKQVKRFSYLTSWSTTSEVVNRVFQKVWSPAENKTIVAILALNRPEFNGHQVWKCPSTCAGRFKEKVKQDFSHLWHVKNNIYCRTFLIFLIKNRDSCCGSLWPSLNLTTVALIEGQGPSRFGFSLVQP